MLTIAITHIDNLIKTQLFEIVNHVKLKKLFARWIGLEYLSSIGRETNQIKLKICDLSWNELKRELDKHADIETTLLFKLIYSEEYDQPGGEPYGLLIGDYEFAINNQNSNTLYYLGQLAELMQLSFVPLVTAATSSSFELNDFKELNPVELLRRNNLLTQTESWLNLRKKDSARYISLVMPNVLFDFYIEHNYQWNGFLVKRPRTWVNAAFAMAGTLMQNFKRDAWFLRATGVSEKKEIHGVIPKLKSEGHQGLLEVLIDEQLDKKLAEAGLTTMIQLPYMPQAYFLHMNSISFYQYPNDLSHTLPYLLCACRFAHYIKILQRNYIGSAYSMTECQQRLENWLNQYIASNHDLPANYRHKYPLTAGKIELNEYKGSRGVFHCKVYLQPYLKTNRASLGITITTDIKI